MRHQLILLGLLCLLPFGAVAKSYGSGHHHSYSSKSGSYSYSSGSHGSYSSFFSPSSPGKSSSGGSLGSFFGSSGKTYSSGLNKQTSDHESTTWTHGADQKPGGSATASSGGTSHFFSPSQRKTSSFDADVADAQQHQESQKAYTTWKTANTGSAPKTGTYSGTYWSQRDSYDYQGFVHHSYSSQNYRTVYTHTILVTRPVRLRQTYLLYYNRPQVIYHDPYSSMFWWWLLDQSIDSRAQWAYNYRYSMDPVRYQLLMNDADLASRVQALEAQQAARNANYTPPGLDQDLMYNDAYVQNQAAAAVPANRPTNAGRILFWLLMVPAAGCAGAFVIWGVFFKRWA